MSMKELAAGLLAKMGCEYVTVQREKSRSAASDGRTTRRQEFTVYIGDNRIEGRCKSFSDANLDNAAAAAVAWWNVLVTAIPPDVYDADTLRDLENRESMVQPLN